MRKTDKKIDNAIRSVLTEACDIALEQYAGFQWLTHFVNYNQFPESLSIVCVYDTNENLVKTNQDAMCALIQEKLITIDIKLKGIRRQISFDTEENCLIEHGGKWKDRFS